MTSVYTLKKWISILIVCTFLISALTMSVSANELEAQSLLKDKVRPVSSSRQIINSSLDIGIEIENSLDYPIIMNTSLAFPKEYIPVFSNYSHINNSAYLKAGIEGVEGTIMYLSNDSSVRSSFKFPINGSFPECDYYVFKVSWSTINFHKDQIIPKLAYTQTFNVTSNNGVNDTESGSKSFFDLRITDVNLPLSTTYKGDSVLAYVTVHNYGLIGMKAYLNAEVSEDSSLYIGFDRGVDAYYGNGVDMIFYVSPGFSFTYYFSFGPILYDDSRGIWALNGRLDPVTHIYDSILYNLDRVTLRGYWWGFQTTNYYTITNSFEVSQHSSTPRILGAVVDDETITPTIDPATFYEEVVDYPIRIGEGDILEDYTTFEEEFGVDFRFTSVGYYDWDDTLHGSASGGEAFRNTAYALGKSLKLGGNWVSELVDHPTNSDYTYGYTQRENHGFDIGLGLMFAGYDSHNGEGMTRIDGSLAVTMGALSPNYPRVQECALHELCHMFCAIHGDEFVGNEFGYDEDGFNYVMADPTGQDLSWPGGWRMHTLTRELINDNYHLRKFDGAPPPEFRISEWYGQKDCYVMMGANQPTSPAYVLSSNGYYRWSYNSQEYDRFTITNEYDPDINDPDRTLSSKKVSANIDYYGAGTGAFFIAYEFYWTSNHHPTGFSPSQGLGFSTSFWLREGASTTISSVDNVQFRIVSSMIASPVIYENKWFKASSPTQGWIPCHNTWAKQTYGGLILSDSAVYILFGVYDAWTYDWSQNIKVHPEYFKFKYDLSSW